MLDSGSRWHAGIIGSAVLGFVAALLPFAINPHFYFLDDIQHQYLPTARDIGRMLTAGHLPWLSLELWQAGNYLVEYYQGVLNPLALLQAWVTSNIRDNYVAAFLFALPHVIVAAVGTHLVVKRLTQHSILALVGSFCVASNVYNLYWNAASWHAALVGFSWLPLCWYFALRASEAPRWAVVLGLSVFEIASCGSPQAVIAAGVLTAAILAEQVCRRDHAAAVRVASATVGGLLLAAPTYAPLAAVMSESARASVTVNSDILVPSLVDLLQFSNPAYLPPTRFGWPIMDGVSDVPYLFAAWFILPLASYALRERPALRTPGVVTCLVGTPLFLLCCLGPEQVGPVRWPIRFVPYLHLLLVVSSLVLVSHRRLSGSMRRSELTIGIGLIGVQALTAWQRVPGNVVLLLIEGSVVAGMAWVFYRLTLKSFDYAAVWLLLCGLLLTAEINWTSRSNLGAFQDWGEPRVSRVVGHRMTPGPLTYTFYFGSVLPSELLLGIQAEYKSGSTFLDEGLRAINGYSPVGRRRLSDFLCMADFGHTCPLSLGRLLSREPRTRQRYSDLMRVNRIVARRSLRVAEQPYQSMFGTQWHLESEGRFTATYVRQPPADWLPGTVAFADAAINVVDSELEGSMREVVSAERAPGFQGGLVVFGRLWWPGYRATINGSRVDLLVLDGLFPAVHVPAGSGRIVIELEYWPAGLNAGIAIAALGALLIAYSAAWRQSFVSPGSPARAAKLT